jgi:hypothetical protein
MPIQHRKTLPERYRVCAGTGNALQGTPSHNTAHALVCEEVYRQVQIKRFARSLCRALPPAMPHEIHSQDAYLPCRRRCSGLHELRRLLNGRLDRGLHCLVATTRSTPGASGTKVGSPFDRCEHSPAVRRGWRCERALRRGDATGMVACLEACSPTTIGSALDWKGWVVFTVPMFMAHI